MTLCKAFVSRYSFFAVRYCTCFALKERKAKLTYGNVVNFHHSSELLSKTNIPSVSKKNRSKSYTWKSFKKSVFEYGIVGSIFHVSTSILLFGSCYIVVTKFGQLEGVLEKFHSSELMYATPGLNFIVSLGMFKSLFPLRAACTSLGTWSIVRYYRCRKVKKEALALVAAQQKA